MGSLLHVLLRFFAVRGSNRTIAACILEQCPFKPLILQLTVLMRHQLIKLKIKASKTDQFRKGVDILGRTHNHLCPVEALLAYIAKRGKEQGLLFRFEDKRLLTKKGFVSRVREALFQARINERLYSGYSFSIGAATTASHKGLSSKIQTLGRWEGSAYLLYARLPINQFSAVFKIISTS